ncbi:hypothetical protein OAF99_00570 [Akkermansiaceae bacterium]|nr:hypothetical protein [Akkermansiaceae bacterium]MDB4758813.1 hypothetical protein [Akkermansiaceae bacterium]
MNINQSSLKFDVLMTIATALVVGLVLLMFASSDDGLDDGVSVGGASGRTRVIGERAAEEGGANLAELVANQARQDAATPRVDVSDQAILGKRPVDSPKSLMSDDVEASSLTKESSGKMTGIRRRLLLEAAEKALFSKTPWSDLSVIALAFKRAGDEEAARYWFLRAARLAQDPDNQVEASMAMREVVKYLVSANFLNSSKKLVARIPVESQRGRAKAELVKAFSSLKRFEEAREIAGSLQDSKAKGLAYSSIAEAEARLLELPEVMETLSMISETSDRYSAFSKVASILASRGDSDGAISLINRIDNTRLRDVALARLVSVKSGGNSFDSLVSMIRDPFVKDQAVISMISNEADRRRINLVSSNVERIQSPAEKEKAYEALVSLQIRHGDLMGALNRAQSIGAENVRNRALQAVALAEVRKGGIGAARKVANLINDLETRETAYRKLAQQAAVSGQSAGAVDTVSYIDDPSERALAFASLALTRARYGDDGGARELVKDASRELNHVSSARDQAQTAGMVAEVFAQTGDSVSAFGAAASISNAGLRDQTYQRLAMSFANSQEAELAEQSAHLIERETTRERALDSVALTLAKRVPFTDALDYAGQLGGSRQQVRFLVGVAGRKS